MTRDEHLAWAKQRALEYLDRGDVTNAIASMVSDVQKCDELKCHLTLMAVGMLTAMHNDSMAARRWIEGFR
jgi:Rps23 Pro-64 3,4-dihydroxylase Tpa1-like proline 4-hydroxylase